MKTIPINKWTIGATLLIAFTLVGIGGASASSEPKIETRTITKTKTVKDDSQTYRIAELEVQLEACQESTLISSQAFVDTLRAYVAIADGASTLNASKVAESTAIIESMDGVDIGAKARLCDPTIASKITGLPE